MNTDFTAYTSYVQHEHELATHLEQRRVDAEHEAHRFGGDRIALLAHWARVGRAARLAARPAC